MQKPTPEQIEKYIEAADLELGPECCDEWVEWCRQTLRDAAALTGQQFTCTGESTNLVDKDPRPAIIASGDGPGIGGAWLKPGGSSSPVVVLGGGDGNLLPMFAVTYKTSGAWTGGGQIHVRAATRYDAKEKVICSILERYKDGVQVTVTSVDEIGAGGGAPDFSWGAGGGGGGYPSGGSGGGSRA